MRTMAVIFLITFGWCYQGVYAAKISPLKPPSELELQAARELVEKMINRPRGPYQRIRWFCADGTVLPPEPYACSKRGGGRQHAEYAPERQQLAQLGWHVGTVFAALPWEEFWGSDARHQRLRELPLERFMIDHQDGWILHQAQYYRGRVQLEDEEAAGHALLTRLMQERDWIDANFYLARVIIATLPHGASQDRTQQVRHLAQSIAENHSEFNRLRIEIHSRPSSASAARVRAWGQQRSDLPPQLRAALNQLADGLDDLFGTSARQTRLKKAEQALAQNLPRLAAKLATANQQRRQERVSTLSLAIQELRANIPAAQPTTTLYRFTLLESLATEIQIAALEALAHQNLERRSLLRLATDLLLAAQASGLLSSEEQTALTQPIHALLASERVAGKAYAQAVRRLSLAANWGAMTVRYNFSEALLRYSALDASAQRFVDEQLRASVLLPYGEVAHRLALDGGAVADLSHHFLGQKTGQLLGINPGVARARLRVMSAQELANGSQPATDEIVVLPETVAELNPVAGILTLGEGNPLSHVQMLARNLGIPNVVVDPVLLPRLKQAAGQAMLLAVSNDGRVYLQRQDLLPSHLQNRAQATAQAAHTLVETVKPDLQRKQPIALTELHAGLSGTVVGPKAANVGELARRFPGRIAPAVAIPFGVFADYTHVQRTRVARSYARLRNGEIDQVELDATLDAVRAEVAAIELQADLRNRISQAMTQAFGDQAGVGVFVRSDTNVEDLPAFTGAGLNETVPNVVGVEAQLAAIPRVWASVYSRRAMAWRGRILKHPDQVYASILLMKSIPAEKSGVLVTINLNTTDPGLTVSAAWGVGGAVDNESAATHVLRKDGSRLLLAQAKAPYQRRLDPSGGFHWQPAPSGEVLDAAEQAALRALAAEVVERYPPALDEVGQPLPWDIEFAFAGGKLWLLQIRPLVQRGHTEAAQVIHDLLPSLTPAEFVALDQLPEKMLGEGL